MKSETQLNTPVPKDETINLDPIVTDLIDTVKYVFKKVPIIIAIGLVVAVAVYIWAAFFMTITYQASEKLYVSGGSNAIVDLSDLQLGSTLSSDYRQVFHNSEIHEQVREKLYLEYTDEQLNSMISVTNPTGRIIAITVSSEQSEYEALRMTEEYCELASLFIEERMGGRIPSVFQKAMLLDSERHPLRRAGIAAAVCCVLLALIIAAWRLIDDRIFEKKHLTQAVGVTILGVVPMTK